MDVLTEYQKGGLQKNYYRGNEVQTRSCPLCDSARFSKIYRERGAIGIVKCLGCGLIYTNPFVRDSGKNYWGNSDEYLQEARLIFQGNSCHHRDQNYKEDLRRIEKIKPKGNFLDIGTNIGFFLRHTRGRQWNVYGLEPSPALSEMARKYFGLNVKTAYLEDAGFKEKFFDVITLTDVFEHIAEPKKMLLEIKRILKDDGIVFIKVPNGLYNLLKLRLAALSNSLNEYDIFDSYEHLVHYSQHTLKSMLKDCGFTVSRKFVSLPIHPPVWHKYVGQYYQYPSPWPLDIKNMAFRTLFYWIGQCEFYLRLGDIGWFCPHVSVIARKS